SERIKDAVTVEYALRACRETIRANLLRHVREKAAQLARELACAMTMAKTNGVLKLDSILDGWNPKEQKLIVGELTALSRTAGGMDKGAQQTAEIEAIAWRHTKTRDLEGYCWAGTFSQRNAAGIMESS